jgi:cytidylate kinase
MTGGQPGRIIVTIDGPAASGKSSVARRVAQELGIAFVSSGLLYRAAACLALKHEVPPTDEHAVLELLGRCRVSLDAPHDAPNCICVDDQDISGDLHTDEVDQNVSAVAKHPQVRGWVNQCLRHVQGSFVIEGRDMGTAVFPHATHKFYLNATPEVRASRRVGERGSSLEHITAALRRRDELDAKQLEPAPDAVHVDTSNLTMDEVVARVLEHIRATA